MSRYVYFCLDNDNASSYICFHAGELKRPFLPNIYDSKVVRHLYGLDLWTENNTFEIVHVSTNRNVCTYLCAHVQQEFWKQLISA